jgi:D-alanyl-D-alanine carboxypeptidase (penicillin-binding protein 5/6)
MFAGLALGVAVIVVTQWPLSYSAATIALKTGTFVATTKSPDKFAWPKDGSGAVSVPELGVVAHSPRENVQPIASLTKMMTAYLALQTLPLGVGQSGPCHTVTDFDVRLYNEDQANGQSSVKVVEGTQLCELDLLNGIFVHSAGNYAVILVHLTGFSIGNFVKRMNATAHSLGMFHTHYADVTGIDDHSISTAADQIILVDHLMQSPLIRTVVRQTSVVLPGAGVVHTYTPLLGTRGVVGIKSGFTSEAGGCDAMAVQRTRGGITFLTFAVILGQHGSGVLTQAGDLAHALALSAASQVIATTYRSGTVVGTLGWRGATTSVMLANTTSEIWWQHTPTLAVTLAPFTGTGGTISAAQMAAEPRQLWDWSNVPDMWSVQYSTASPIPGGTVIGDVQFAGDQNVFMVLYAKEKVERPPWWNGVL